MQSHSVHRAPPSPTCVGSALLCSMAFGELKSAADAAKRVAHGVDRAEIIDPLEVDADPMGRGSSVVFQACDAGAINANPAGFSARGRPAKTRVSTVRYNGPAMIGTRLGPPITG